MRRCTSATYLVAMVTQLPWQPERNFNNSFVLHLIEVIFGMKLSWDDRHQSHTLLLWQPIAMATTLNLNNSFVLSCIEFIFGMAVL